MRKTKALLGMTLLLLVLGALSPSTIFADGATKISGDMLAKDDKSGKFKVDVGDVAVTINEGDFTVKIRTTGLVPQHMHSVWWEFVDKKGARIFGAFNLAGGISSGDDGTGNYTGHFKADFESGFLKFTIKDHGEVSPGEVPDQKKTKDKGCNDPPGGCPDVQKSNLIKF